ncbi:MAG: hypothetical protein WBD40_25780, partial [Tepidisphaeraceae bacterium]
RRPLVRTDAASNSLDDGRATQPGASLLLTLLFLTFVANSIASAASKDLGGGFKDHGVASPISNHRGTVATLDGDGRNVVLVWLFDHRGGYALLLIDAQTGKAEQFPMPFPAGDAVYASILSSANKFYTQFNSHFVEFDPVKRAFTFSHATTPQMAMGMTEDDDGVIWSVSYPDSGVVSFDPKTRAFVDYGSVHPENWKQYQRHVAADDAGWIYFGLGNTASQIIAFDPKSRKATPIVADADRKTGMAYVVRDVSGKVYGQNLRADDGIWYELHKGEAKRIDKAPSLNAKPIITGNQALFHATFPDGKRIKSCDLLERKLTIEDPKSGDVRQLPFEYTSEGAGVMGVEAAPDGTITGGTYFPMRGFSFEPKSDTWANRKAYGQFNAVARQGDRFFFGGYPGGFLLEWDPAVPWTNTVKNEPGHNPQFLTDCTPTIHRPHKLLAHPDGKTIILAGTPNYGYTGGGLLFWDRATRTRTLLTHEQIIPNLSTSALVPLEGGKLLAGTTTSPGTGGEQKAKEAELYVMDMAGKKVEWRSVVIPGAQWYTDLCTTSSGLVYGVADRKTFFVFDPAKRAIVHQADVEPTLGLTSFEQSPRVFVPGPAGEIYMAFAKGIVRVEPEAHKLTLLAESPVPIEAGGAYLDGRIYVASGSHLYSYKVE